VTLHADQAAVARRCLAECVAEGSAKLASAFPRKNESAGGSTKVSSERRREGAGSHRALTAPQDAPRDAYERARTRLECLTNGK
jgi:hypothetical protein